MTRPSPADRGLPAPDGTTAPPRRARLHERLGFRLSFLLALALLPLGLIGLVQAQAWRDAAREQAASALMGETLRAAAPTVGLIREAQGAAAALAGTVERLPPGPSACVAVMTALQAASPQYSIAAYVPADGFMRCGSGGASFDYSETALFRQMKAEGFPAKVYVQERGPVSGVSVVLVAHPVGGDSGGAPSGYVALALPHAALVRDDVAASASGGAGGSGGAAAPRPPGPGQAVPDYLTFNGDGTVLSTSRGFGEEAAILPAGLSLAELGQSGARTFVGYTADGEERDYSVVPVVPGVLYALGSLPARRAFAIGPVAAATPLLFTTALWAASLFVAWWAAERLVTRHMRRLSHAITAFAGGAREVDRLEVAGAPAEVREVAGAFQRMTDTILHDEAELEDGLRQREVLLREVHHRSRNNLQLIASIMNMQARRARSPEAKALMRALQERVMSLASVHRELYQSTGVGEVRADELLADVARQVLGHRFGPGAPARPILEADLAPLRLVPDQAVPLALLLTEAMTEALGRAAGPAGAQVGIQVGAGAPRIRVALSPMDAGGRAVLSVEAPQAGGDPDDAAAEVGREASDLGRQLLAAFAAQVGGQVEDRAEAGTWRLAVTFPVADPTEA